MPARQRRRGGVEPKDASERWTVMAIDRPRRLERFPTLNNLFRNSSKVFLLGAPLQLLDTLLAVAVSFQSIFTGPLASGLRRL